MTRAAGAPATRRLAETARQMALRPFHGYIDGKEANIGPMIRLFPRWSPGEADGLWCAAFVYYCCVEAGFAVPYSPDECVSCSLAGCGGWEEFAMGDRRLVYGRRSGTFVPEAGDIILYDRVFCGREHDHMGIVLEVRGEALVTAEGNLGNVSGIASRPVDEHIRAYIRIPDGYRYRERP